MRNTSTCGCAAVDPAPHGYYNTADLRTRWGCGRTKLYETIWSEDFPTGVILAGRTISWPRHLVWEWEAVSG